MPTQTLAAGPNLSQFGAVGFDEVTSPAKNFSCIVGEAGVGKTSLYREHSGALIFNFDLHSTPKPSPKAPPPKCAVFPVLDAQGRVLDENLEPVTPLTWEHFQRKIDQLVEAAIKDQPRPETIVFDTISATVELKKQHYALTNLGRGKTWDDFPGGNIMRSHYGKVYDSYARLVTTLRNHGYGVHFVGHLVTSYVDVGEDGPLKKIVTHNIPDKIFGRVFAQLEFLAAIELVMEAVVLEGKGGRPQFTDQKVPKRYLINLSDTLKESTRCRIPLPERIELPPHNAWQAFESAYLKASGKD